MTTNVEQAVKNFDINTANRMTAVADIHVLIESKPEDDQVAFAHNFIYEVFGVRVAFEDRVLARLTVQYVIDAVAQTHWELNNAPKVIEAAQEKANAYYTNPNNAWQFATSSSDSSFTVDSDTPKPPKKNKGTTSAELYDLHVKNAVKPLTNIEFVHLLVKELGMTTSGARTYSYNQFKAAKLAKEQNK